MIYSLPQNINISDGIFPVNSDVLTSVNSNWQHGQLLYGAVILEPILLDLGNLSGAREDTINLWNISGGDLVLNNIIGSGVSGLNLTGKTSGLIINGEVLQYTLQSLPMGDANIDATYSFNFDKTEFNTSFNVIGSRLPIFDYELEWSNGQRVYYKHYTNILESYNGKEERYGISENARVALEYYYKVTGNIRQKMENLIYNSQNANFQVPLWLQPGYIMQDASAGDLTIFIDATNTDIQEGFNVYVGDYYDNQIVKIETFDELTGQATLENNLISDIKADQPVYLLAPCKMTSNLDMSSVTRDFTELMIRFEIDDNTISNIVNKVDNIEEYDNLKVLYQKPSIDVEVRRSYNRKVDVIDNGYGVRQFFNQDKTPEIIMNYRFDVTDKSAIKDTLAFFENTKGRLNEFLITSGMRDIYVVDDIEQTETTITVENNGQKQFVNNVQRNKIRVVTNDNVYYKTILDIQEESGFLKLFLDSSFGVNINAEDIIEVQFLSNARLNNDEFIINYITPEFITTSIDCKIFKNT